MIREQVWICLFEIIERDHLQDLLNQFIRDHDVININVWHDPDGLWCASVHYKYIVKEEQSERRRYCCNDEEYHDDDTVNNITEGKPLC